MISIDLTILLKLPLELQVKVSEIYGNSTKISEMLEEANLVDSNIDLYRECAKKSYVRQLSILSEEEGLRQLKQYKMYPHIVEYKLPNSHIAYINSLDSVERMQLKHTFFEKHLDAPIEYVHHRTFGEFVRNYNKNEIYGYEVEDEDYTDFLYQKGLTEGEPVMMLTNIKLQSSVDVDYDEYAFETHLEISFFNTKQEAFNALETRISEIYKEEYDSSYASFMKKR